MAAVDAYAKGVQDEAQQVAAGTIADLTAQLAKAEAQVRPATLFGSSAWLNPGESWTDGKVWTRLTSVLGPLRVRRVYDGGQGLAHAIDCALAAQQGDPTVQVVMSWKDYDFAGITDNTSARVDWYVEQFARLNPGIICAPYHEYDRKILVTRDYDLTTLQRAWSCLRLDWREAGSIGRWACIVTGNRIGQVPFLDAELIGIDPYPAPGQTAWEKVGPILDQIRQESDLPVAVCEIARWGQQQDPDLIASLGELRGRVESVCWFNAVGAGPSGTVDFRIDGDATKRLVYRAVAS